MAGTQRILLIDDDPKVRAFAAAGLRESGLQCTAAEDGREALALLEAAATEPFDTILLDIMMPGLTGWEFLAALRERDVDTPVIFVTAREGVDERVRGLRMGADDYIIKPFAFSELLARIEVVQRRRQGRTELRFGNLHLDLSRRAATLGNVRVELSPKEFDLLRLLVEARGATVSRGRVLREVWHTEHDPGTNVIEVHMARLRRRLALCGDAPIRTVRGRGYALEKQGGALG